MQSVGSMLDGFLEAQAGTRFSWKSANCGHFIGAWLLLVERVDYVASLTFNMPRNAAGARRLAVKNNGMHIVVSEAIRRPVMQSSFAQVGDIVLLRPEANGAGVLAVCNGRVAMARSLEHGIVAVDMTLSQYAWRLDRYVE